MDKFLQAKYRKAIYGLLSAVITALLVFGIITQEQIDGIAQSIMSGITAMTMLMAFVNTNSNKESDDEYDSYGGTD